MLHCRDVDKRFFSHIPKNLKQKGFDSAKLDFEAKFQQLYTFDFCTGKHG